MNYIRLFETTDLQELTLIKISLNSNNVDYTILHEESLRLGDTYVMGNTGAIVQVKQEDIEKAKEVLAEQGLIVDSDPEDDRFTFVNHINRFTKSITILKNIAPIYRFLILVAATITLLGAIIIRQSLKVSIDDFVDHTWCVKSIIHNNNMLEPNTVSDFNIIGVGFRITCTENIRFTQNEKAILPGINNDNTYATYKFNGIDEIAIMNSSHNEMIYDGNYYIKSMWDGSIKLISDKTTIIIHKKH